jgi:hypothetical protein
MKSLLLCCNILVCVSLCSFNVSSNNNERFIKNATIQTDLSNDTITTNGRIVRASDVGWAYTYNLYVDTGNDTLKFEYFSQSHNKNTLLNKEVTLSYSSELKYNLAGTDILSNGVKKITGTYRILWLGGDVPGNYSVTDKDGKSIVIEAFLYEEDRDYEGTIVTVFYRERSVLKLTTLIINDDHK